MPDPDAKTCPSCNANLAGEGDDPGARADRARPRDVSRSAGRRTPKKSRLLSWISGDSRLRGRDRSGRRCPDRSTCLRWRSAARCSGSRWTALIADLTAEAGALAADDADAHGTDPVAAAAALQAEIDAVRRAELVHAQLGLADDVSVVDPDAPAPEPETLTAVVATNGVNAPDELRGVTDLAPAEVVPAPAADDAPEVTAAADASDGDSATGTGSAADEPDAAAATTDEAVPAPAAPAPRGRRFRRSR